MNIGKRGLAGHKKISGFVLGLAAATLMLAVNSTALAAKPTIHFGVPTWPGVTVQSEVAAQLLETMGFDTKQSFASPAFIINALRSGMLDVYLGGWMPTEAGLIKPAAKSGSVEILTTNISNALMGLAVPKYVWKAGVHSIEDLDDYGAKFNHKIYGIEPGTGFNQSIRQAISNNLHGLGNWNLVQSSTAIMLAQVQRAIQAHNWIVFLGWQPHWMNIAYDLKYLKPVGEPTLARTTSDVLTVVNPDIVKKYPEVTQFLTQFKVSKDTMSTWIMRYSREGISVEQVASNWIANNIDKVAQWLKGVETIKGKPAIKAVKEKYKG